MWLGLWGLGALGTFSSRAILSGNQQRASACGRRQGWRGQWGRGTSQGGGHSWAPLRCWEQGRLDTHCQECERQELQCGQETG